MTKSIEKMNRVEVIFALRAYAHPSWYHDILTMSTQGLRALLTYYKTPRDRSMIRGRRMDMIIFD